MAVVQTGSSTAGTANVDANYNLNVNTPTTKTQAGYSSNIFENDDGSLYGTKQLEIPNVSDNTSERRLNVGLDTPLFNYTFNATAQDTGVFKYVTATMTNTWGTTGMLMNANSNVTASNGTCVSSYKQISLIGNAGLSVSVVFNITTAPLANEVVEFGLFPFTAGTAAPTEGVYLRFSTAGLIGIVNYNGTETPTSAMATSGSFAANTNYTITIKITDRSVEFYRDGVLMLNGILALPVGNGQPFATGALPLSFQYRNSGTVSGTAMQAKITDCWITQKDVNLSKPYPHIQAAQGLMGYQGTSGNTQGTTALYTNSLAPGAGAVMTNTTAALGTGLGGQFSALPTLAVSTDGIICSYTVPAGSVNIIPRTLYITGIRIQGAVTTVLVGNATAVTYAYSLGFGCSSVNLTTAEQVAVKSTRRIALGYESYAAAAAVGTIGQGVSMQFASPIVVNPSELVSVIAKNIGVVTTTGVITFLVTFDCYWE